MQMIGLVDGNNFFVSCERIFAPGLEGRPVAVLSNNDGCCVSRSNEFKALGIPMGTPYFQVKPLMERHGIVLCSSNYGLYGDISRRVIAVLEEFAPKVEQYSIDEAFIHPGLPTGGDYYSYGVRLRRCVLQWVGIPCGVGFAPTRTLAKLANHIGKKLPSGVFVMPEDCREILENTPVSEIWGVGRALAPKLMTAGIRTARQLAEQDPAAIRRRYSVVLAKTVMELRGVSCIEEEAPDDGSKSISCSRSFGYPVESLTELEESVAAYASRAAEKLRREGKLISGANVYLQPHRPTDGFFQFAPAVSATVIFDPPTDDTGCIVSALRPKVKGIFTPGCRYRKSGVIFFGLEKAEGRQGTLFGGNAVKSELFRAADKLNAKFGRGTLFLLGEGIEKPWQMKRDMLSPAYTTDWNDIPVVK